MAFENYGNFYYILIKDVEPREELLGANGLRTSFPLFALSVYYGINFMVAHGYGISREADKILPHGLAPPREEVTCKRSTAVCD